MGTSHWQLVVVVSLELTASAPFLDFLPKFQLRREGKEINDGYGAPAYSPPKPSYSPCSYRTTPTTATTTTTTPSPSYGAPAPAYGAPEPSYGAPRTEDRPAFPDILGFIGDIAGNILNKHNKNNNNENVNQYDCLEAPLDDGYGVPQAAPEESSYEAPQSDTYEAPQSDTYEAPQSDTYKA